MNEISIKNTGKSQEQTEDYKKKMTEPNETDKTEKTNIQIKNNEL